MTKGSAEFLGAWLGRGTVPLNQFSDLLSAFDRDEGMQRDIFVTEPGEKLSGSDIVGRSIQKGIPILKQALPEYQPATREKAPPRDSGPFKQMTGLALIAPKNEIETEIERLNIPFFSVFRSTGDKTIDSQARKFMAENIETSLMPYLRSDQYKSATREGQFGELKNRLSELQTQAKNIAIKQSIQDYYSREQVPPIEQKKFEALPPKVRKATTDLYKDQLGRSLNEDTDFRKFGIALELSKIVKKVPLAVQEDKPGFAVGGVVGKQALKKAGKSSVLNETMSLLQQVRKEAGVPDETLSPAIDQTANMLMGKKPVLPKTTAKQTPALPEQAAKPAPIVPESPALSQTDEAIPTLPAKTMEAPMPSKAFADEDYVKGEELMKEAFDEDYLTNWKIANPNDYANTLHSYTGQAIGVKYKDMPPPPFAAKVDDTIEYDMKGKEIKQGAYSAADEVDDQLIKFERVNGAEEGDLNKKFTKPKALNKLAFDDQVDVTEQRNNVLMTIKQDRKDQFKQFRKSKDFDIFDDEALAVLQGDFRVKNGRELNLKTDREDVLRLATDYQKQLDDLRVKYKDTPPVKLYHGGMDVEGIKNKGFFDPQSTTKNFHQEMLAGAPSFTRDLNFNFSKDLYGGTTPSNFVYTEVPYADYMFTKVNMTPANYDAKDLNTIAQSINGSSYVARPVSLPRASYYEKEDMFPEANKLTVKDASSNIEKLVSRKPTGFGGRPNPKAVVTPDALKEATKQTEKFMDNAVNSSSGKEAYFAYNSIRDLMQKYASMGANVQTKGGIGQQYATKMNTFSDKYEKINKIANILESSGAKQRAETLKSFAELLQRYNDIGGDAAEEAARVKDLTAVFDFVPKLAKGGLASRR
jgi:hypothetical protein